MLYILTEEERIHIKHTLALLNSMIRCGDNHSEASQKMFDESLTILNTKGAVELTN